MQQLLYSEKGRRISNCAKCTLTIDHTAPFSILTIDHNHRSFEFARSKNSPLVGIQSSRFRPACAARPMVAAAAFPGNSPVL